MRILGIDPGLNTTGYGVVEVADRQVRLVEAGVVRGKTKGSLTARVQEIHDGVADVIRALKPEAMALEKLYAHYDRPTTAILMGHARGVIVLAAAAGGHRRARLRRDAGEKDAHRQRPGAEVADAGRDPPRAAAVEDCPSRRTWPMRWRLRCATRGQRAVSGQRSAVSRIVPMPRHATPHRLWLKLTADR